MTTRGIEAAFPLTPLQEGMLYHTIREPAAGVFHVQCTAVLSGSLDTELFTRAWELVTARHAAMRTFVAWEGRERPLQVVRQRVVPEIELADWSSLDALTQDDRWAELRRDDRARAFDLAVAPLMRVTLARLAPDRHRLLWSMHHALMDGWSVIVVLDDVIRDYRTLAAGAEPNVVPGPSFDRFVGWMQAQDRTRDEQFWRRTLAGVPGPVALPGGGTPRRGRGDRVTTSHVLAADDTRALRAAAARHRVTVNTLLMAAWSVMLGRHSGSDDVVIGVTVSERPPELPDIERAAGLYLSTVPVRVPSMRDASVGEWLRALQLALSDARVHAAPGLAAIQRWTGAPSTATLFDSLVVFENFPDDAMRPFVAIDAHEPAGAGRLTVHSAAIDVPNDVPLVLLALPGERLALNVVYDPVAVPSAIAERIPAQLATILDAIASGAIPAVRDLPILGTAERTRLVDDWSGAHVGAPAPRDVLDRFERHVTESPDAIALLTENRRVTYAELGRHAARLTHRLVGAGLRHEQRVGILADHADDAIVAMLAALAAGVAYVPLDPRAPDARLHAMVASLHAVFAVPSLASRVPSGVPVLLLDAAGEEPESHARNTAAPESAAYVIFTSGSTGEPKGVVVERGQLAASNSARDVYYDAPPGRFLLLSPVSVDSSVAGIYWTLGAGGTLVLPPPRAEQDIGALTRLIAQAGVTHTLLIPSLYRAILEHADPRSLASLRCVIVAGEACGLDVVRLHHARLPGVALHNEYGPSEATVWATAGELGSDSAQTIQHGASIGRPIAGARVYILDESLRLVPIGAAGEICIGGACVARGYLGEPAEGSHRFVTDPFTAGGRIYRTGDRGRFSADGRIEFLGRIDEQIKVRGFRIEPAEIERALMQQPGVREAAVALVRPSPPSDPESLVAALAELPDELIEHLLREAETVA